MARVVVDVLEEVAALLEKEPLLRFAVAETVKKEAMEYRSQLWSWIS